MSCEGENRFESDARRYAAYLETPEGRLRTDLAFANLQDFLSAPPAAKSLRALDLGGTGTASVRLARLGFHVTLLDSSPAMLELAKRTIADAGVSDKITLRHGDAARFAKDFEGPAFEVILCHNLLEYLDDASAVLRAAARLMRDPSSALSILVRAQAGEVLKAALQSGDLTAAERNLTAKWGTESLYQGKVRLFTPEVMESMLKDASLTVVARRGVRAISDYLPAQISRANEYERIFALERALGCRQEFFGVARYMQYLARPSAALFSEVHE